MRPLESCSSTVVAIIVTRFSKWRTMPRYIYVLLFMFAVTFILPQTYGQSLSPRIRTKPVLDKPPSLTRDELKNLWKFRKPDPDTDFTDNPMGISKHIVNGKEATRGQFPWQAGMTMDQQFFCGGSLITRKHILSAAHCVESVTSIEVVMGAQQRDEEEDKRQSFTTTTFKAHPKWDTDLVINDIAIIILPQQAKLNEFSKLMRLPRRSAMNKLLVKSVGIISGWGKTADDSVVSQSLNYLHLRVVPLAECIKLYGKDVTRSVLCVRNLKTAKKRQGTCNGDSGGPYVMREKDGEMTQVGLVSFGAESGCGKGHPDVFTRVAHYLNWIEAEIPDIKIRK